MNELDIEMELNAYSLEWERENKSAEDQSAGGLPENLLSALEAAKGARRLIAPLQEDLRELLESAENEIERRARQYQIDLIGFQLNRAADLAEYRLDYLARIRSRAEIDAEVEKCQADLYVGIRSSSRFAADDYSV